VLRLLEKHPLAQVRPAVAQGLQAGALTRDAIAQFLHPQPEWRMTLFSLAGHPHLQHVKVTSPDVTQYAALLGGAR